MNLLKELTAKLDEDENLQGLGKALAGKKTDVNTPPADVEDTPVEDPKAAVDVVVKPPEFKVGDVVKPTKGPHKGEPHEVIHVFDDGSMNIRPTNVDARNIKYRLGAAKAQPDEVVLAESLVKLKGLFSKGSLLISAEDTLNEKSLEEAKKPKTLQELKKRRRELSDAMDRIIAQGGRIPMNDPMYVEHSQVWAQIRALQNAEKKAKK